MWLLVQNQEALFLAVALSLDSFCIGICGSIADINLVLFPIFVSTLQLCFLNFGTFVGFNINKFYRLPQNIWSVIAGFLLIFIGFLRFI